VVGDSRRQDFTQRRKAAKKKPKRRLRRFLRESVDDARDTVLDQGHRRNHLDRVDLHDHQVLNDRVCPKSNFNVDAVLRQGNRLLTRREQTAVFQFVCQDRFIDRLQQARPQSGMDSISRIHNLPGQFVLSRVDFDYPSSFSSLRLGGLA
jgi:hypothetical protein